MRSANYGKNLQILVYADFNGDWIIDEDDFEIWQENYGTNPATHSQGDADNNGAVGGSDFQVWLRQVGLQIPWVV